MSTSENLCEKTEIVVPVWEKYVLSIPEACEYFGIGRNHFYELCRLNPDADFLLRNGTKYLIKRKLFESYVDDLASLEI